MTLARAQHPFRFVTRLNLIELTGLRAPTLSEFVTILKTAPSSVIYHHTHHFLKQHQNLSPEPPNDFAYWVRGALNDERLAELLASIDTIQFTSLHALRDRLVKVIELYMNGDGGDRSAPEGEEFHFMKSISFVLPTPYEVRDLAEFAAAIEKVSVHSLYHHIFEARLRLERGMNDFSSWLGKELGEKSLAQAIARLDPYTQPLESLRKQILLLVKLRLRESEREASSVA